MPVSFARTEVGRQALTSMGTVLVVEDPLVSKLVRSVLQRHGYEVKLATPSEAAALLEGPEVGILLTNSPSEFLEFSGRVPLLYLTSSPDVLIQTAFHSCRVVVKPFVPEDLVRAVGELAGAL